MVRQMSDNPTSRSRCRLTLLRLPHKPDDARSGYAIFPGGIRERHSGKAVAD